MHRHKYKAVRKLKLMFSPSPLSIHSKKSSKIGRKVGIAAGVVGASLGIAGGIYYATHRGGDIGPQRTTSGGGDIVAASLNDAINRMNRSGF